jgi:hypothetical protein
MTTLQPEKWIKKRGRPTQEALPRTSNSPSQVTTGSILLQLQTATLPSNKKRNLTTNYQLVRRPYPTPPIYITNYTNIPPLIQLLDQLVPQHYKIKALAHNQVKVQPKNSDSCHIITKALVERHTQLNTYKLKEERTYRVVLKTCTTPLIQKKSKPK